MRTSPAVRSCCNQDGRYVAISARPVPSARSGAIGSCGSCRARLRRLPRCRERKQRRQTPSVGGVRTAPVAACGVIGLPRARGARGPMAIETERGTMTGDEIVALTKRHTLFEWSAQSKVDPDPGRRREGLLLLDARGQALPRLQQPADVHQHRPRPPEGHRGHPAPGRDARLRQPVHGHRAAGAPRARSWPRSRPATSTPSSSPTAAPRPTRTPSSWPDSSPAATRSWPATARTTAARPAPSA